MDFIAKLQNKLNLKHSTFVIAEIGINFNGDLELAKKTISQAIESGASAVKFQTFKTEEFIADRDLTFSYTSSDGTVITEKQWDMFKKVELPDEWHSLLFEYAKQRGSMFFSSVADRRAVDLLDSVGVECFKMASEDLINVDLLEYVAKKGRPTILSIGMANEFEIDNAVRIFTENGNRDLCILQCVSNYPTSLEQCNLLKIKTLKGKYGFPVGFSDHTLGNEAAKIAVALGATVLEKHFTSDKKLPGPDHAMSLDPQDLRQYVNDVVQTEQIMGSPELIFHPSELLGRNEYRRSLVANKPIPKGTKITKDLVAPRRPGQGLKPYEFHLIEGKIAKRDINVNQQILITDVE